VGFHGCVNLWILLTTDDWRLATAFYSVIFVENQMRKSTKPA